MGSSLKTKFELRDGQPVLVRLPELNFNDDKGGKPVGSTSTSAGARSRRSAIPMATCRCCNTPVRAAARASAFTSTTTTPSGNTPTTARMAFARLDMGLDEAAAKGWTVVSMKTTGRPFFRCPARITAIDILLEPDATMLQHAAAEQRPIAQGLPEGLRPRCDAHSAHHTAPVFRPHGGPGEPLCRRGTGVRGGQCHRDELEAFKLYYVPAGGDLGLAGICAKPTPEILKLQADVIAAASPSPGRRPIGAFTAAHDNPAIGRGDHPVCSTFEKTGAGANSIRTSDRRAPTEDLDKMLAEPFESFTFSPAGAAVSARPSAPRRRNSKSGISSPETSHGLPRISSRLDRALLESSDVPDSHAMVRFRGFFLTGVVDVRRRGWREKFGPSQVGCL